MEYSNQQMVNMNLVITKLQSSRSFTQRSMRYKSAMAISYSRNMPKFPQYLNHTEKTETSSEDSSEYQEQIITYYKKICHSHCSTDIDQLINTQHNYIKVPKLNRYQKSNETSLSINKTLIRRPITRQAVNNNKTYFMYKKARRNHCFNAKYQKLMQNVSVSKYNVNYLGKLNLFNKEKILRDPLILRIRARFFKKQ